MSLHLWKFALIALVVPAIAVRADEPKANKDDASPKVVVISAAEAKSHLDETVTVEMTVKKSKNSETSKSYYLDSEADYDDEKNLAIVISYDAAPKFKEAGIDDPAAHFKGKTIRVTGKVVKEGKQVRIRVTDPKQIVLATTPEGKKTP